MARLFNMFKIVNGRLVQFDDFSNTRNPVQPSPESEPSEPIPSNPDPEPQVDPLNPLGLPPYTIRVKYADGTEPGVNRSSYKLKGAEKTLVNESKNIWDVTYTNADWSSLFFEEQNLLAILGANTSDVTVMGGADESVLRGCFEECNSLTTVALFDTSNVTTMERMFVNDTSLTGLPLFDMSNVTTLTYMCYGCSSLTEIPLFVIPKVESLYGTFEKSGCTNLPALDVPAVITIENMCRYCYELRSVPLFTNTDNIESSINAFGNCTNVQSGALALYQQLSSNANITHSQTFSNCGASTDTGMADLVQIPIDWGGIYEENPSSSDDSDDDGSDGSNGSDG